MGVEGMRAFVFPGQGGKVVEPEDQLLPVIRRVVGEHIPEQVKVFARAARDADESRKLALRPDVVAGHSLGEYGAAYSAGCFDFETGLWAFVTVKPGPVEGRRGHRPMAPHLNLWIAARGINSF